MENRNNEPTPFEVLNTTARADILTELGKAYNVHHKLTHNPAPNPVSLHREHLPLLTRKRYVVAEKTDGTRFQLVMGRMTHMNKPFAVLVNRSFRMFQVQLLAPKSFFNGSVFDGEMVWNRRDHCLTFMTFDVARCQGKNVGHQNLIERYQIINRAFPSPLDWNKTLITNDMDRATALAMALAKDDKLLVVPEHVECMLFLFAKPFVNFTSFGSLSRSVANLPHESDGFVLTPVDEPVRINTQHTAFKWKYTPTVDLQVHKHEDSIVLSCQQGNGTVRLEQAVPEYAFQFHMMEGFTFNADQTFIIETSLTLPSPGVVVCTFHRFRTDKTQPNKDKVIRNILQEVQENITLPELVALSEPQRVVESAM